MPASPARFRRSGRSVTSIFTFQHSVKCQTISHLAQLGFLAEAHNVLFSSPPGTGRTRICRSRPASRHLGVVSGSLRHRIRMGQPPRPGTASWTSRR
ncbi:MAG: ATP-binding protein [Actinomycetota bacterium]